MSRASQGDDADRRHDGARRKAAWFLAGTALALAAASASFSNSTAPPAAAVAAAPDDAPAVYPSASPCPVEGDRGDPLLNDQKNRFHAPDAAAITPKVKTADDILALPVPNVVQGRLRSTWDSADAAEVAAVESEAAQVEGFVVEVINENKAPGESSNCHRAAELHDFHIYFADAAGTPPKDAVVVEMTPRWRAIHPSWEDTKHGPQPVRSIVTNKTRVRVTGWLMLDEEHLSVVGTERGTIWEIHPVTKFETQAADGTWSEL